MAFSSPYPPETREAVDALLRRSGLTMTEIAEHTGIAYVTVRAWNRQARIRPWARPLRLDAHSDEATHGGAGAVGSPEVTTPAPPGEAPDLASLDAALRGHIARQIAAFDETLRRRGGTTDTAKVLRDLGGLKRLLDDLRARQPESNGDANGESQPDLAALREDLARRYEAFETGGQRSGVSGEPAGHPTQGADR